MFPRFLLILKAFFVKKKMFKRYSELIGDSLADKKSWQSGQQKYGFWLVKFLPKSKMTTNEAPSCPISIRMKQDWSSHREASFWSIMGPLGAQKGFVLNGCLIIVGSFVGKCPSLFRPCLVSQKNKYYTVGHEEIGSEVRFGTDFFLNSQHWYKTYYYILYIYIYILPFVP